MGKYFLICFLICFCTAVHAQNIRINRTNPLRPVIYLQIPADIVDSISKPLTAEEGKKWLALYRVLDNLPAPINVIGNYTFQDNILSFVSQFDLEDGAEFEIQTYAGKTKRIRIARQKPANPPAMVLQVFPLSDTVPSNILYFHIRFSQPMTAEPNCFEYISILDSKGQKKEQVWKQRVYWFDNRQLLVLMIHPGRVKRGINYLDSFGDVFTEGETCTLVVTSAMKDQYQRPVKKEYRKTFTVGEADRVMPLILPKAFEVPATGTSEPLKLTFSEKMDYVSIREGVHIFRADGSVLPGKFSITPGEREWHFIPDEPWKPESYEVQFDKKIADLASNFLHRPFEITSPDMLNAIGMPKKWRFTPLGSSAP